MNKHIDVLADGRLRPHIWNQRLAFKGYALHLSVSRDAVQDRSRAASAMHNRLAAYRVERGISRQHLADQLNIRLSTLDALENQ
ncbi:hypothetical protein KDH_21670 [Dictyobacter sp. S3.2.2.5]|uniref:HTH cro/C1-type domain-containing protein n=1 Tax=Dictyobacter halimunensis TaxID=3026934 RepID=A0ABQ6FS30_9CHLR|nr:hypothetical protein KDH_21670 [Dictyobacter sp. S3.2.2.5]